jgi:hypothetical protein
MKVRNLILVTALSLMAFTLKAQEGQATYEPPETNHRQYQDEGKTLNEDHSVHVAPSRDTTQVIQRVIPATPARVIKPDAQKGNRKEKEEEDALSFNFLYYMIQKFKLSDLIDQ